MALNTGTESVHGSLTLTRPKKERGTGSSSMAGTLMLSGPGETKMTSSGSMSGKGKSPGEMGVSRTLTPGREM